MYNSITRENICLSVCPGWEGNIDIYKSETKEIEIGIRITNKSKEVVLIDQISLRIKKGGLLFNFHKDVPIEGYQKLIDPHGYVNFIYNLKPILDFYGNKKKLSVRIKKGKMNLESHPISIKEMHNYLVRVYARHI
jgi:hypothetical protein